MTLSSAVIRVLYERKKKQKTHTFQLTWVVVLVSKVKLKFREIEIPPKDYQLLVIWRQIQTHRKALHINVFALPGYSLKSSAGLPSGSPGRLSLDCTQQM